MNREAIIAALLARVTAAPTVFAFAADTTTGEVELVNVSDTTGLRVGMPVSGDGLPGDAQIATVTPTVTINLPAIADRSASALVQGFQTISRRPADPSAEQDMPALYLVEPVEIHSGRGDREPYRALLQCELQIFIRVPPVTGDGAGPAPAAILNHLLDSIAAALSPSPYTLEQNLGLEGVLYARIEGELQKDYGSNGQIAGATVPIVISVAPHTITRALA